MAKEKEKIKNEDELKSDEELLKQIQKREDTNIALKKILEELEKNIRNNII